MKNASVVLIYENGNISVEAPHTLDPQWKVFSVYGGEISRNDFNHILSVRSVKRPRRGSNDILAILPVHTRIIVLEMSAGGAIVNFRLAKEP